jgi:2-desacetyl-2-hydroxyethyl bacteriochlorophyllide A dehydrogenase
MKYIVCEKPGRFKLKEKSNPLKVAGEAIVSIKKIGICGTDLHAYTGNQAFFTYPRVLGHELAAEVLEIEENNQNIQVGDKVIVMPYISCGHCVACRNGKTNCCTKISVLGVHADGGMQEQISIPINLLIPANSLSYEEMAIAEPLAIGAHAVRRAQIQPNEFVAIIGCGPIGIGIMKLAQLAGAKVIAMDRDPGRLNYAKDKIGIDHTVLAGNTALDIFMEITDGEMATVVFDATGNKEALEKGLNYMAFGGRYILVGLSNGKLEFDHPTIHAKETAIICSRNATLEDFKFVIAILEKGEFPVNSYITHNVGFTEMIPQFDSWLDPGNGVIKAIVNV